MCNELERLLIGETIYIIYQHGSMVKVRALVNGAKIEPDKIYPNQAWAVTAISKNGR